MTTNGSRAPEGGWTKGRRAQRRCSSVTKKKVSQVQPSSAVVAVSVDGSGGEKGERAGLCEYLAHTRAHICVYVCVCTHIAEGRTGGERARNWRISFRIYQKKLPRCEALQCSEQRAQRGSCVYSGSGEMREWEACVVTATRALGSSLVLLLRGFLSDFLSSANGCKGGEHNKMTIVKMMKISEPLETVSTDEMR